MPATVDAGDLLLMHFVNDGNATVTTPAGWTLLNSTLNGTQVRSGWYYKLAAGTEGGTTDVYKRQALWPTCDRRQREASEHPRGDLSSDKCAPGMF